MQDSFVRKHEPLIYSGVLLLASAMRAISAFSLDDSSILLGTLGSLVIAALLFLLIWRNNRTALLLCGVYMLLSGILGTLAGTAALMSSQMLPANLLIAAYALFCLWGGYRLVRIWKSRTSA